MNTVGGGSQSAEATTRCLMASSTATWRISSSEIAGMCEKRLDSDRNTQCLAPFLLLEPLYGCRGHGRELLLERHADCEMTALYCVRQHWSAYTARIRKVQCAIGRESMEYSSAHAIHIRNNPKHTLFQTVPAILSSRICPSTSSTLASRSPLAYWSRVDASRYL